MKDIENLLTSSFSVDRIDEVLICNACIVNPENILLHDQNHTVPGLFRLQGVEHEKEKVQSRQLRHLKEHMISHLKSQKHQANIENQKKEAVITHRRATKIEKLVVDHKLPYLLFEHFLPILSLNSIDIGQINHSEMFLRRILNPCYKEPQKRLSNYLNQDLSCTGHPRPVTLLLDKGTIKHNTSSSERRV